MNSVRLADELQGFNSVKLPPRACIRTPEFCILLQLTATLGSGAGRLNLVEINAGTPDL